MGLTIREATYQRFVRFGGRTIKAGESAVVWNARGEYSKIEGPKRVWLVYSTIRFLSRYKAEKHQYLRIHHHDGHVEYVYGPVNMYKTPFHDEIKVCNGIQLETGNDCILVRTGDLISKPAVSDPHDDTDEDEVHPKAEVGEERIVKGPSIFLPAPNETVHTFRWSIVDENGNLSDGITNEFQILKNKCKIHNKMVIPITTMDAVKLLLEVSLEYEVNCFHSCVRAQDPIRTLYTALRVDAVGIGQNLSSKEVRNEPSQVATKLSQLSAYSSVSEAASSCGMILHSIFQVSCKFASSEVQNRLVEDETKALAMSSELALLERVCDLRKAKESDRLDQIKTEAKMEWEKKQADAELAEQSQDYEQAALKRELFVQEQRFQQKLHEAKRKQDLSLEFFLKLHEATGVDVSKIALAMKQPLKNGGKDPFEVEL